MNNKKTFGISARAIRCRTSRRRRRSTSMGRRQKTWQRAGLLLFVCECLMCARPTESVDVCIPEHFLYTPKQGPDICHKCFPGTFMPHHLHTYRQCFECTQIQDPQLEIFVSPCNLQQDTEIHCVDGYFRIKPVHPDVKGWCQKCKTCPFPKGPCSTFSDTICCPSDNYVVRINKEGNPQCVRLCGPGLFLDPTTDQCLPCPAGTFMHEDKHTHIFCWNCNVPGTDHEVVIQPCTSTQPAIIECEKGYYRQFSSLSESESCTKCQVCSENISGHIHEIRPCGPVSDRVCCPDPDMIVMDTSESPECQYLMTTTSTTVPAETENATHMSVRLCGEGEYLRIGYDGTTPTCLPCPNGTCMPETNHFRTSCQACAHMEGEKWFDTQTAPSDHGEPTTWKTCDLTKIVLCAILSSIFSGYRLEHD